eukprot:COSAG06_NODE_38517_length_422_cov_2.569659_1_plen_66_part_01
MLGDHSSDASTELSRVLSVGSAQGENVNVHGFGSVLHIVTRDFQLDAVAEAWLRTPLLATLNSFIS